jgi:hypothetical protein
MPQKAVRAGPVVGHPTRAGERTPVAAVALRIRKQHPSVGGAAGPRPLGPIR